MRLKNAYLALCIAGTVAPLWPFLPWLREHGLDLRLFVAELFANRISATFAMDVTFSALALAVFVLAAGRREGVRHLWAPIVASLVVGVSLGLPLFLYLREATGNSYSSIPVPPRASFAETSEAGSEG